MAFNERETIDKAVKRSTKQAVHEQRMLFKWVGRTEESLQDAPELLASLKELLPMWESGIEEPCTKRAKMWKLQSRCGLFCVKISWRRIMRWR